MNTSVHSLYKNYYPDVLVVRRCQGFCGTSFGQSYGEDSCQPEQDGKKNLEVALFKMEGRRLEKRLTVTEHTSCWCVWS